MSSATVTPPGDAENDPSKQVPSAWAALLSVQKENARLRKLVAESGPATKTVTRSSMRRRVSFQLRDEEDELEDDDEEEDEDEVDKNDEAQNADEAQQQLTQKLVRFDKARLASLESGLKRLEADKAQLLEAQQLFDTQRMELVRFHEQLLAAKADIETERTRAARQNAATAQENINRNTEAEARVKEQRRSLEARIKGEWARAVESQRQLEADREKLVRERSRMSYSVLRLVDENGRLEELTARLEGGKIHLEAQTSNLAQTVTHLERENRRIERDLSSSKKIIARLEKQGLDLRTTNNVLHELNERLTERERELVGRRTSNADLTMEFSSPPQHSSPGPVMLASPPRSSSPSLRPRKRTRVALHDDEDYENPNARTNRNSTGTTVKLRPRRAASEAARANTSGILEPWRLPLVPVDDNARLREPPDSEGELYLPAMGHHLRRAS
ncbi:hypothetical protein C8R46DRAFT_546711 [Mycena filopes]|nr:hypothetical protein C8R46DRAFT_546711 [Mycena filopes]